MLTALAWPVVTFAVFAITITAALKAWRGWLDFKRHQLAADRASPEAPDASSGVRIEMAALKERLRRLEDIATGVDL
jgi:hypothetical protein